MLFRIFPLLFLLSLFAVGCVQAQPLSRFQAVTGGCTRFTIRVVETIPSIGSIAISYYLENTGSMAFRPMSLDLPIYFTEPGLRHVRTYTSHHWFRNDSMGKLMMWPMKDYDDTTRFQGIAFDLRNRTSIPHVLRPGEEVWIGTSIFRNESGPNSDRFRLVPSEILVTNFDGINITPFGTYLIETYSPSIDPLGTIEQ